MQSAVLMSGSGFRTCCCEGCNLDPECTVIECPTLDTSEDDRTNQAYCATGSGCRLVQQHHQPDTAISMLCTAAAVQRIPITNVLPTAS